MPRTERTVLDRMIGSLGEAEQSYASDRIISSVHDIKTELYVQQDHCKNYMSGTVTGSLQDNEKNYTSDRIIT